MYLTEEDFKAAEEEAYRAIEVLDFVPLDEIDPIAFQRTYYLGPAEGAEKVYALLVKAMSASGLAAVARYVFHDRQQLGVLRIRDGVITLESMYFADEIRSTEGILPEKRVRVDAKELEMAADPHRALHDVVRSRQVRGRVPRPPARRRQAQASGRRCPRAARARTRRPHRASRGPAARAWKPRKGSTERAHEEAAQAPRQEQALVDDPSIGPVPARRRRRSALRLPFRRGCTRSG